MRTDTKLAIEKIFFFNLYTSVFLLCAEKNEICGMIKKGLLGLGLKKRGSFCYDGSRKTSERGTT